MKHNPVILLLKKKLSYFFPFTRRIPTMYNGTLEINWYDGRKMLDSPRANYSYGSLQRILRFGLKKTGRKFFGNVLVLGLGGGSIIDCLRKEFRHQGAVTAVELDPVVIDLALNEFHHRYDERLEIICADARQFVNTEVRQFDLVIVDLFHDDRVLEELYRFPFWENLAKLVSPNGIIIFNAAVGEPGCEFMETLNELSSLDFRIERYDRVEGSNTLLLLTLNQEELWNAIP
jgi:spermidine synthase